LHGVQGYESSLKREVHQRAAVAADDDDDATGLSSAPPNFADDEEDDEEASSNSGSVGKRTADHHHHHNNNNNYNSNQASGQSWALAAAGVREEAAAVAQGMNVVQSLQQQQHNHPNTHGVPSVDNHPHLHGMYLWHGGRTHFLVLACFLASFSCGLCVCTCIPLWFCIYSWGFANCESSSALID
jgi:hypothetical protein